MATAQPEHGSRPEQLALVSLEPCAQLVQGGQRRVRVGPGDEDRDQVAERRIAERLPALELAREEPGDVVVHRMTEGRRVRLEGLHEHAARCVAPAASRKLRHELERPLLRPEVGQAEARVRVDHRGERDARHVMPLRHHLRPNEHRAVGGTEPRERLSRRARAGGDVGVEPEPLELGQPLCELRLEALRARPDPRDLRGAAFRARGRDCVRLSTVMAAECAVSMERERHVAVRAAT